MLFQVQYKFRKLNVVKKQWIHAFEKINPNVTDICKDRMKQILEKIIKISYAVTLHWFLHIRSVFCKSYNSHLNYQWIEQNDQHLNTKTITAQQ